MKWAKLPTKQTWTLSAGHKNVALNLFSAIQKQVIIITCVIKLLMESTYRVNKKISAKRMIKVWRFKIILLRNCIASTLLFL